MHPITLSLRTSHPRLAHAIPMLWLLAATVCLGSETRDLNSHVHGWYGVKNPDNQGHAPGPILPWGVIHPSPETFSPSPGMNCNDGYVVGQDIRGFSQLRRNGFYGTGAYGYLLFSPQVGRELRFENYESPATNEVTEVGYYKATLSKHDVTVETSAARHSAIYEVTFPATNQATFLLDLSYTMANCAAKAAAPAKADTQFLEAEIDPQQRTISGKLGLDRGFYGDDYYFFARYDTEATETGVWKDYAGTSGETVLNAGNSQPGGFWLTFDTTAGQKVKLKLAISWVSIDAAKTLLDSEIPHWDLQTTRSEAETEWDSALSRILIDDPDATPEQLEVFYSAFYRAQTSLKDLTGDNPNGDAPLIMDVQNLWDSWMMGLPFAYTLFPDMGRKLLLSNLNIFDTYRNSGLNSVGPRTDGRWYNESAPSRPEQAGELMDAFALEMYLRGTPGVNWEDVYELSKFHADNARSPDYRVNGWDDLSEHVHMTSKTIDFYYTDWCVARLGHLLGKPASETAPLFARSEKWKTELWSDALTDEGFTGFVAPRLEDGTFLTEWDPSKHGPAIKGSTLCEGSGWTYSWYFWHDLPGLFEKMGGTDASVTRLEYYWTDETPNTGNEPGSLNYYIGHYLGRPDIAARFIANRMDNYDRFGTGGNDDGGHQSSFYILNAIGLPTIMGSGKHFIVPPLFSDIVIQFDEGQKFRITSENHSANNPYIVSATLNGQPLSRSWITGTELLAGGHLHLVMGSQPGPDWGTSESDLPRPATMR